MLNIEFLYWIPGPCIFIIRTELNRGKYLLHADIDIGGHSTNIHFGKGKIQGLPEEILKLGCRINVGAMKRGPDFIPVLFL